LPTEKSLVVSFWIFFKFLGNQGELERKKTTKNFVDAGMCVGSEGQEGHAPLDFHTWYKYSRLWLSSAIFLSFLLFFGLFPIGPHPPGRGLIVLFFGLF